MSKRLTVIYRSCGLEMDGNLNVCRPREWFDKRKCWKSFFNSFGDKEGIKIIVVYDGKPTEELYQYMYSFKSKEPIVFYNIDVKNNEKSLLYCYELAEKVDSKYIYFLEDDYIHLPESDKILLEGLDAFGKYGTMSLFHHRDRLIRDDDITRGSDYIFATNSCYWATRESNTCSFSISKELFLKYKDEFNGCGVQDRLLFRNLLQKHELRHFNPISEKYGASHMSEPYMPLFVNWKEYGDSIKI